MLFIQQHKFLNSNNEWSVLKMAKQNTNILKDDYDMLNENADAYEVALNSDNLLTAEQIEKVKRLEFSAKTKKVLAQRVGYRCSCPECKNITIGPGDTPILL